MSRAQDYYPDCPEVLLVSLAQSGDHKAFEALVIRYQAFVRNLMRRLSGQSNQADDLAQQALLLIWRKLPQLEKPTAFKSWLIRLSTNLWFEQVRKNDVMRHSDAIVEPLQAQESPTGLGRDLESCLAHLAEPVRLCIVLAYQTGLSHPEIAEATGLPIGTVKSHIRRGSQQLQDCLADYQTTEGDSYA